MNEQFEQQVFDSFLEEAITGHGPPDLTARIQAAWEKEQSEATTDTKPLVVAEIVAKKDVSSGVAARSINGKSKNGKAFPDPAATVSQAATQQAGASTVGDSTSGANAESAPSGVKVPTTTERLRQATAVGEIGGGISQRRTVVAMLLAVSAAILLIVLGWQTMFVDGMGPSLVNDHPPQPELTNDQGERLGGRERDIAQHDRPEVSSLENQGPTSSDPGEGSLELNLDNLPFDSPQVAGPSSANPRANDRQVLPQRLEGDAVVAELDEQLSQLWRQVGVSPTRTLDDAALAEKMFTTLVASEQNEFKWADDRELNRLRFATYLTSQRGFASKWSDRITRQWLKRSSLPLDSEPVQELRSSLAAEIVASKPWNEIVLDVLGAELGESSDTSAENVFISALAGGGNHRLLKRVGFNFMNANLACIRCHDDASQKAEGVTARQETYWTLVALLNGVDARGNFASGGRQVTDKQPALFGGKNEPVAYYDLLNGRLKSASARMPGGESWKSKGADTPRKALAVWLSNSELADTAIVNQTWKSLFGRPLVLPVGGVDVVAEDARKRMLTFLTGQFRAHDRDLKSLVGWMVASEAFARSDLQLEHSQWLAANDDELQRIQITERVFGAANSLGRSAEASNLEQSVAALIKWSSGGTSGSALGQLDHRSVPKKSRRVGSELQMPSMSFAVHGETHLNSEEEFVKRLMNSTRLSWEQRVEHIVALSEHGNANGRIQQLAKELLRENDGDRQATLLDLLWAVQNSDARG